MSDREGLPRGFESPYEQFLWKELSIIRELEREGKYYLALDYATSLVKYISPGLREKLGKEGEAIMAEVNLAVARSTRRGNPTFSNWVVQNRVAKQLGRTYLQQFISLLSDSLGERAYMERLRALPRAKGDGRLRVNE